MKMLSQTPAAHTYFSTIDLPPIKMKIIQNLSWYFQRIILIMPAVSTSPAIIKDHLLHQPLWWE